MRQLSVLTVLLLVAAALLHVTRAASAFAGCVTSHPSGSSNQNTRATIALCRTACGSYKYMYYSTSTTRCYCSNNGPTALGTGSAASCSGYTVNTLNTAFAGGVCAPPSSVTIDARDADSYKSIVSSTQQCLESCVDDYQYAVYRPYQGVTAYCYCAVYPVFYTPNTCQGSSSYYVFGHALASLGEQRRRKRMEAALEQAKVDAHPNCPVGKEACAVAGGGYECIDTDSELDSCGGCPAVGTGVPTIGGDFGVDCTALPGVNPYAVTCRMGRCVTYRCQTGFRLVKGECVPVAGRFEATNRTNVA